MTTGSAAATASSSRRTSRGRPGTRSGAVSTVTWRGRRNIAGGRRREGVDAADARSSAAVSAAVPGWRAVEVKLNLVRPSEHAAGSAVDGASLFTEKAALWQPRAQTWRTVAVAPLT